MMKKLLSIIFLLIVLMTSVFAFGCKEKTPENGGETVAEQSGDLKCGFESVKELQAFGYSNNFYKAELNKNPEYVTEGDYSARFTFKGTPADITEFKIFSDTRYFGGKDFSKVNMITLDAFNPTDTPREFVMSFSTSREGAKKLYQKYTEKTVTLAPGHTLVTYAVDRTVALSICDMKYAEYFTFDFYIGQEEYSLYFDNLRVYYTEEQVSVKPKTYEENEILFFDNSLDRFYMGTNTYMCTSSVLPTLSIERDPRYIASGTGSLKVEYSKSQGNKNWDETPCIEVKGEPVERYDFSEYSKLTMKWMPNFDGGRLSVRLRNAAGSTVMFSPADMQAAKKGEWQELTIDLNDAKNGFESEWQKLYNPGEDPFVEGIDIEKIAAIEIFFGHKVGRSFYLDEIRLVK